MSPSSESTEWKIAWVINWKVFEFHDFVGLVIFLWCIQFLFNNGKIDDLITSLKAN